MNASVKEVRSWRNRMLLAFSFGVGLATVLALVGAIVVWRMSRPTPWNESAIQASLNDLTSYQDKSGTTKTIVFRLSFTNRTDADYRIDSPKQFVVLMRHGDTLQSATDATINTRTVIPPHETTTIELNIPLDRLYSLMSTKDLIEVRPEDIQRPSPGKESKLTKSIHEETVALIPSEMTGLVILDETHRYRIEVAKQW